MNTTNNLTIGMLAHVDAGKTTLSEALLYNTGTIRKIGRVDTKDAFLDANYLERTRGITIFSKQAELKIGDYNITLLDTPGHVDFSAEMERTLSVLDYAILVINGSSPVQSHTETLWRLLARYKIPAFIFVNKMDQPDNRADRILEQLKNRLSSSICNYTNPDYEDIALCDEALLNNYLEYSEINLCDTSELIKKRKIFPCFFGSALRLTGIDEFISHISRLMLPAHCEDEFGAKVFKISRDASNTRLTHLKITGGILMSKQTLVTDGTEEKVNQIRIYNSDKFNTVNEAHAGCICAVTGLENSYAGQSFGSDMPTQVPLLEPVLTYSLILPENTDTLIMLPRLKELESELPELHIVYNELLKEIQLQVMGAVQIEIIQRIIEDRFNVAVTFDTGKIVYKESICNTVEGVGHFEPLRHYAEVHLLLEPLPLGSGMQYETDCPEDKLDKNWQRLIMTHLYEKAQTGVLLNSPLTDVKITLVAGRSHNKHTEGGDFRQATYRAIRQGLMQAESRILEPVYSFTIELPTSNVGRAMTDLEQMHASFELNNSDSLLSQGFSAIRGEVPVATLGDYQTQLMAYTKGLGRLNLVMSGYKPCHNPDEVIAATGYDPCADTLNPCSSVFCSHGSGVIIPWDEVYDHMHVESVLKMRLKTDNTSSSAALMNPKKSSRTVSDIPLGTDEIDEILNKTYYANSREKSARKYMSSVKKNPALQARSYKGTEPAANSQSHISYLLVDGYNIIHAWKDLKELAETNMDGARGRLLDILCNYHAMQKGELIVVFDAYRVKGHDRVTEDYNNIHVVYTKEAETADQYIEKFAHEHSKKYDIRVATSDGLEQIIILGQGCRLVSAREFEEEVKLVEEKIRNEFLNKSY